ncbi:MAG: FAD-dependent oxidoreductase [Desulfotignum sp.]|nr:FAD-dependent oxidoreductase [Desulfotignum sp.]MCF8089146.1 FAD-dependent oxidoreductase [Desulfotignum sp.]MCF8138641.1 FAD-dependent oxidoreductase [Desulfotignum sp.]
MKQAYDVVIVGSGVAGIAAANTLAGHGLEILVIDENPQAGGQILRQHCRVTDGFWEFDPRLDRSGRTVSTQRIVQSLRPVRRPKGITCVHQARVLGIFPDRQLLVHVPDSLGPGGSGPGHVLGIDAGYLLLATGARERFLPFKGWTLPGVMSLGAAQILMKSAGVLPARHTLIAGTSPLQMVLALEILKNKGNVTAVLDETHFAKKLGLLPLLKHHWVLAGEGAMQMLGLMIRKVRFRQGVRVMEARGKNELSTVVTADLDKKGNPISGSFQIYSPEALAVGHGFCPNIELPVQAGCALDYDADRGGWVVRVDHALETSVAAVYAAGEITGIAGAGKSFVEGKLAAVSILEKLGKTPGPDRYAQKLVRMQKQQLGYASFLNQLCQVPSSAYEAIDDDVLICRCEEISMGEIRKQIAKGFGTTGSLKKATRCGMGRCQGRICQPVLFDILLALTGQTPDQTGSPSCRAPVKNVPMAAFLES